MLSASSRGVQEGLWTRGGLPASLPHTPSPSIPQPSGFNKPLSLESVNTGLLVSEREPGPELSRSSVPSQD